MTLAALVLVSCAKLGSGGGTNLQPADVYAGGLSETDVRTLLGDNNWWQGPPSFGVRPLDAERTSYTERFSITQQYLHLGTAEQLAVRYTVYDKTSSATTAMTNFENAFGASPSSPKVGDKVLYYGLGGTGGAPYVTRTFVRVGQTVVLIVWSRKDGIPTVQQLGKNAAKFVDGLKKAIAAKTRPSLPAVEQKLLPPPGLDITYLGSTQLPIETWLVMFGPVLPESELSLLQGYGVKNFAFGDFALNNDTHMEVQSTLLTFASTTDASNWANHFARGTPDQFGISNMYVPVGGTPAAGEYQYFFLAGDYGGMLICKPTIDGEAASRECELPLEQTAIAWKLALGG